MHDCAKKRAMNQKAHNTTWPGSEEARPQGWVSGRFPTSAVVVLLK
jgi:hypothetical protein